MKKPLSLMPSVAGAALVAISMLLTFLAGLIPSSLAERRTRS